ncbi:MAG: hypothetical protein ABUS57_14880 [Pseudomonadota bacterium]
MANRSKQKPGELPIDRSSVSSPMKLTRREVARRELAKGIREFFLEGDPVVVHLLASASRDISEAVAKSSGIRVFSDAIKDVVLPEYQAAFRKMIKEPYNFFKHGGSDPNEEVPYFDPASNDMLLLEACSNYEGAFGVSEMEAIVFKTWHALTYPDLLNDHGKQLLPEAALSLLDGMSRSDSLRMARALLDTLDRDPLAFGQLLPQSSLTKS